ncbi:Os03g0849750 [Oryza sativa Japonica Group]|uniref:Os03g0849750 protein n=1 Tax=Oryza sativa subsp. japonica TaxID=39947 RepID=A0A0P0W5G2_ORYSJ|nr:Os03g0849750 [Oryza sativa Japonica Group]
MRNSTPNPVQSWKPPSEHEPASQNHTSSNQHKHQQLSQAQKALQATGSLTGISISSERAMSRLPVDTMPVMIVFHEKVFLSGMDRKILSAAWWSLELRWEVITEL